MTIKHTKREEYYEVTGTLDGQEHKVFATVKLTEPPSIVVGGAENYLAGSSPHLLALVGQMIEHAAGLVEAEAKRPIGFGRES